MTTRTFIAPVLVLGLAGVGVYASPCLQGDCDGESALAASEADEGDTPCAGSKHEAAPEALAAAGDEEPCPYATGDEPCDGKMDGKKAGDSPDPTALAAAGDEEPCPHATGDEPCDGKKDGDSPDPTALAAAAPAAPAAAKAGAEPEPRS